MSSPSYVTQNEYPLDDDTTLMSTTDIHSYITHEQTEGISQINSAIGLIDATTQQNSALVEESVAAAASLNEQALHLKELVRVFRVSERALA